MTDKIPVFVNNKKTCMLVLALLCLILYINTLRNNFVFDDNPLIVNNIHIRSINLKNLPDFFTSARTYSEKGNFIVYRPIATLSFAIDYFLWKLNPSGYHIPNIMFHILNTLLVFTVIGMLARDNLTAFITALLFAAHPIQTEAVSWISSRGNVLFLFCFMLSLYCYIRHRRENKKSFYWLSILLFMTALLCKEMAMPLLVVLFLYDAYYETKGFKQLITRLKAYIPYVIVALLYMLIRYLALGRQSQISYWGGTFFNTMSTMFKSLIKYISTLVLPVRLNVDPTSSIKIFSKFLEPGVLISLTIIIELIVLSILVFKRNRHISFGIVWFFITFLPVSNLIPLRAVYAERFMYLPSIGFCLILASLFSSVKKRKYMLAALTIILALYSFITIRRNFEWKDSITLWTATLKTNKESVSALICRGVAYKERSMLDKALADFNRAIELDPKYPKPYNNRGVIYNQKGKFDRSVADYSTAIELNPEYSDAYNNRGVAYMGRRYYDKAIADFNTAIELNPIHIKAYCNRGTAYREKELHERAIKDFSAAIEIDPEYLSAYNSRGVVYELQGYYEKAIADFSRSIGLNPEQSKAYYNRGNIFESKRLYDKAIADYSKVIEISPGASEVYNKRGVIYRKKELLDRAIADFDKALELNPEHPHFYNNRGVVYGMKNFYSKAIVDFNMALKLNPEFLDPLRNRGIAYWKAGFTEKALTDLDRVIELNPEYENAHRIRNLIYKSMKKKD